LFDKIVSEDLPRKIRSHTGNGNALFLETDNPMELTSLEEMSRRYIAHVLKTAQGNQSVAAQILQIDRKTLYRKLQKLND
jgi:DNA-binding NtrC family response regulator